MKWLTMCLSLAARLPSAEPSPLEAAQQKLLGHWRFAEAETLAANHITDKQSVLYKNLTSSVWHQTYGFAPHRVSTLAIEHYPEAQVKYDLFSTSAGGIVLGWDMDCATPDYQGLEMTGDQLVMRPLGRLSRRQIVVVLERVAEKP